MKRAPIGLFDSGLGGLSVAREAQRLLPAERLLYVGDTAHCPYGGRPAAEILARSLAISRYLVSRGAKLVVVACNAASGASLEQLRVKLTVPVVGMEPAVKPAAAATRNGRVGVMATEATIGSDRFARLMREYAAGVQVVSQPCPGLVELVEAGEVGGEGTDVWLRETLEPLKRAGVDTVVLGCTHYPFLLGAIGRVMGEGVVLIETGGAVARQTRAILLQRGDLAEAGEGGIEVLVTGDPERAARAVRELLGERVEVGKVAV
ncbi:MAG: glutamate racemase [Longimicrobiaceae bacterium]